MCINSFTSRAGQEADKYEHHSVADTRDPQAHPAAAATSILLLQHPASCCRLHTIAALYGPDVVHHVRSCCTIFRQKGPNGIINYVLELLRANFKSKYGILFRYCLARTIYCT